MRGAAIGVVTLALAVAGCGRSTSDLGAGNTPTFNHDVAPIVFTNCAPCHRPGQAAPFTLLSYADAKEHADKIAKMTRERRMPPWLPAPGGPAFAGERRLSDDTIGVIQRWVGAGAPEGNPRDLPKPPVFPEGWQLGTPDVVVESARPYVLAPGPKDVYRNLVLSVPIRTTRFVKAVEFSPGDAPVHHAVIHLDRTSGSRRRDGGDGQPGFDGMGGPGTQDPEGHFVGWAPGRGPIVAPPSMPWRLDRGTDLVVELHLIPGKSPVNVRPKIALFLEDRPATATPATLKMGSQSIDIPAGVRDYAITDSYALPVDVDLLSLYPHAHFLGKEMLVQAKLPDGSTRLLLHIPRWSFHWQQDYRYVDPVRLPRGTVVTVRFTYDNSDHNIDNPHSPPKHVMVGQESTDEMGNLLLQVVPLAPADREPLVVSFARHEAEVNLAGAEMFAAKDPSSAANQRLLGSSYAEVGRNAEAVVHLERALRLNPRMAEAHNDLGGVLIALGRPQDALAHFRQASTLAPNDEHLHFNVAKMLAGLGQPAEAGREFRRAINLNPDFADAHDALGVVLFSMNRLPEALTEFRKAVELAPDSADFHNDLGGALAQAGRFDEALTHVRRALELRPDFADARENLSRLERIRR